MQDAAARHKEVPRPSSARTLSLATRASSCLFQTPRAVQSSCHLSSSHNNLPSTRDFSLITFLYSNTLFSLLNLTDRPLCSPDQQRIPNNKAIQHIGISFQRRSILWPFSITGTAYSPTTYTRRYHRSRHGRSDFSSRPGRLPIRARSIPTKLRSTQTQRRHRFAMARGFSIDRTNVRFHF
jgi:hypothetical protein